MSSRFASAAWLLLLVASPGCGSITGSGDDDDTPSDGIGGDDDPGDDPGDASDDPDDGDEDGGSDGVPAQLTCVSTSGARLRQHVRRHSDGSSVAIDALRDSELEVDCSWGAAADGSLRCLPWLSGSPVGGFGQGRLVFTGSDCEDGPTIEAFSDPESGEPPIYAQDVEFLGTCQEPRRHFYELGDDRGVGPGETLYARTATGCDPFETGLAGYYAIAGELPVTTFVAGERTASDTGRLAMSVIDAEDGARACGEQLDLVDDQLGSCRPMRDERGQLRCLPGADDVRPATTASCGDDVFGVARIRECEVQTLAKEPLPTCGGSFRIRELAGPPTEPVYAYPTCERIDEDEVRPLSLLGDTVDPSRFVPLGIGRIPAGGRLDRIASTTEGGLALGTDRWFDRELGVECVFTSILARAACTPLPELGSGVADAERLYGDAGCSAELLLARPLPCEEEGQAPRVLFDETGGDGAGDPFAVTFREVGARHQGPLYRLGDGCVPVGADEVFYDVGAEIPLDALVTTVAEDEIE